MDPDLSELAMGKQILGTGTAQDPYVIQDQAAIIVSDPVAREAIAILRGTDSINEVVLLDGNGTCVGRYTMKEPIPFKEGDHAYVNIEIRKG